MSEFANEGGLWAARIAGAVSGAGVSLIYLLPKGKREAASRFITGMSCGLIFGGPVGIWLAQKLDIAESLTSVEIMLSGSAAASLTAWWVLGLLVRFAARYAAKLPDG